MASDDSWTFTTRAPTQSGCPCSIWAATARPLSLWAWVAYATWCSRISGFGSPIGSITFAGMALGHVDVGRMIRVLEGAVKRNGGSAYLNPFYTSSQKQSQSGQATVTFSATVDLGPAAFSGRFQRPGQTGGR